MERQVIASRIVQRKDNKKEDYLPRKQDSDESADQLEKSCLSDIASDRNSKKRIREADTTMTCDCESKKRKTRMPAKLDSGLYHTLFHDDDWLFGNTHLKKNVIKNDQDMMIIKKLLQMPPSGDYLFPKAQFLPQVKIFVLPYTVPF